MTTQIRYLERKIARRQLRARELKSRAGTPLLRRLQIAVTYENETVCLQRELRKLCAGWSARQVNSQHLGGRNGQDVWRYKTTIGRGGEKLIGFGSARVVAESTE